MKITVSVSKKVQEYEFEPFTIHLSTEIEIAPEENQTKVFNKEYKKLEKTVDLLIKKRLEKIEGED